MPSPRLLHHDLPEPHAVGLPPDDPARRTRSTQPESTRAHHPEPTMYGTSVPQRTALSCHSYCTSRNVSFLTMLPNLRPELAVQGRSRHAQSSSHRPTVRSVVKGLDDELIELEVNKGPRAHQSP
jgi:hypothetical protein